MGMCSLLLGLQFLRSEKRFSYLAAVVVATAASLFWGRAGENRRDQQNQDISSISFDLQGLPLLVFCTKNGGLLSELFLCAPGSQFWIWAAFGFSPEDTRRRNKENSLLISWHFELWFLIPVHWRSVTFQSSDNAWSCSIYGFQWNSVGVRG